MKTYVVAFALAAAPAGAFAADGAAPERLTVDDAVKIALQQNQVVRASREQKDAADDSSHSVRGRLLPTLAANEEYLHYRNGFAPTVHFPGVPGPGISFPIHDQNTNTFVIAAQQPVLGLLHLSMDLGAANSAADAAGANVKVAEMALTEAMRTAFLRLFQARAQIDIAKASERQLAEQIQVAKSKYDAGVLTKADLLRLEVAAANAQQQQIQGEVQEQVTRASILSQLDREPDAPVEFVEPKELEQGDFSLTRFEQAAGAAVNLRPEVLQAEAQAHSAEQNATARMFDLFPEVNLEAAYVRIDGQALAEHESEYVGVKASWPFWEWGSRFYSHRAAAHRATAARLAAQNQRRQVSLDVSNRLATARAAASAVQVARTAITSAEEAYRVTDALVKAGSATTTDLLDSQAALTQARLSLVRARYEQAIAHVALERATAL